MEVAAKDKMRDDSVADGLGFMSTLSLLAKGLQRGICTYPATLSLAFLYITIPING